jgi:protein-S-isoprenylcysteine O-methyltransferase Ste14
MPMMLRELGRCPGADGSQPGSPLVWLLGFAALTGAFGLIHFQWSGSLVFLLAWLLVAPAFALRIAIEWRRLGPPRFSGAPLATGRALTGQGPTGLWPSLRLWGLKAFFVPLYALSLFALLRTLMALSIGGVADALTGAVLLAFTVDVSFGLSGYLFASNRLAETVRSTQPRLLGWAVCVACYEPVFAHWPAFRQVVLTEITWPSLIASPPQHVAAAVAMLLLLGLYVSATVVFGLRFSNLTNRGVITSGPYRLMKHPAYFAHAANAWIISLVFLPFSFASMLVPVAFTVLYRLRAVTEEQHMSEDPAYRAYCAWIDRHGLLAKLCAMLPSFNREPRQKSRA